MDMDTNQYSNFQSAGLESQEINESYGDEEEQKQPNTTSISKTGIDKTIGENANSHSNYDQPSIEDDGYAALRDVVAPFGENKNEVSNAKRMDWP